MRALALALRNHAVLWRQLPGLNGHLVVALTLALVTLPQAVAFSVTLAGVPPHFGIYAAIWGVPFCALLNPSRVFHGGPNTAMSAAVGVTLLPVAAPFGAEYMGLALRNPLVASPSPLSYTLDGIRRLADGGVGAIVMFSLFEEQLREQAARAIRLVEETAESFPEALDYFPAVVEEDGGPRGYLVLLERAVSSVDVPVIASLNGVTPEGWTDYARAMQDAGAAAIELNIYYLPGDPEVSGREVEQRHIDVLEQVKAAVSVPVAVKLSPYFSSPGEMALRLDEAGADALVLFNRFLQPDIDPEQLAVLPRVNLSSPADARLARTWIALLRGRVRASLAATSGVEVPADLARYLLAGADAVMTTSALLRHGSNYAAELLDGLTGWMARKGFESLDQVRGLLAVPAAVDEVAYERGGYVAAMRAANAGVYNPS